MTEISAQGSYELGIQQLRDEIAARDRETERLKAEGKTWHDRYDNERLRAALQGLLGEVMCFSVDPPSVALNHAIEEARRVLESKP